MSKQKFTTPETLKMTRRINGGLIYFFTAFGMFAGWQMLKAETNVEDPAIFMLLSFSLALFFLVINCERSLRN